MLDTVPDISTDHVRYLVAWRRQVGKNHCGSLVAAGMSYGAMVEVWAGSDAGAVRTGRDSARKQTSGRPLVVGGARGARGPCGACAAPELLEGGLRPPPYGHASPKSPFYDLYLCPNLYAPWQYG